MISRVLKSVTVTVILAAAAMAQTNNIRFCTQEATSNCMIVGVPPSSTITNPPRVNMWGKAGGVIFNLTSTDVAMRGGTILTDDAFVSVTASSNASVASFGVVAGSYAAIGSGRTGTGTYLPLGFFTSGAERGRFAPSGELLVSRTLDDTTGAKIQVNGNISAYGTMQATGYRMYKGLPGTGMTSYFDWQHDPGNNNIMDLKDSAGTSLMHIDNTRLVSAVPQFSVTGDIFPMAHDTYSLGNLGTRWKELYIAGTIYVGNCVGCGGTPSQWITNGTSIHYPLGNVGIDITAPNFLLSLGASLKAQKLAIYDGGPTNFYGFGIGSGQLNIEAGTSGSQSFITNGAEAMRINNAQQISMSALIFNTKLNIGAAAVDYFSLSNSTGMAQSFQNNYGVTLEIGSTFIDHGWALQSKFYSNDGRSFGLYLNPMGGRVAVGTSSPKSIFHVTNQDTTNAILTVGGGHGGVGDTGGRILFRVDNFANDPVGGAMIAGLNKYAGETNGQAMDMGFFTNQRTGSNSYTGLVRRMTLTQYGQLGIGMDPAHTLDVNGNIGATSTITTTSKGNIFGNADGLANSPTPESANIRLYDYGGGNWAGIGADGGGNMWFRVGLGSTFDPTMVLNASTLRVGIGTITPAYKLEVVGDVNLVGGQFRVNGVPIGGNSAAGVSGDVQINEGGLLGVDTGLFVWDKANHRLGVGTGVPSQTADFISAAQARILVGSAAGFSTGIAFYQPAQTVWTIYEPASNNDLRIFGGGDKFTFTQDNYFGIGTTAPGANIQIARPNLGPSAAQLYTSYDNTTPNFDRLRTILARTNDDTSTWATAEWSIGRVVDATDIARLTFGQFQMKMGIFGVTRMIIDRNGNVGVGTGDTEATHRMQILDNSASTSPPLYVSTLNSGFAIETDGAIKIGDLSTAQYATLSFNQLSHTTDRTFNLGSSTTSLGMAFLNKAQVFSTDPGAPAITVAASSGSNQYGIDDVTSVGSRFKRIVLADGVISSGTGEVQIGNNGPQSTLTLTNSGAGFALSVTEGASRLQVIQATTLTGIGTNQLAISGPLRLLRTTPSISSNAGTITLVTPSNDAIGRFTLTGIGQGSAVAVTVTFGSSWGSVAPHCMVSGTGITGGVTSTTNASAIFSITNHTAVSIVATYFCIAP